MSSNARLSFHGKEMQSQPHHLQMVLPLLSRAAQADPAVVHLRAQPLAALENDSPLPLLSAAVSVRHKLIMSSWARGPDGVKLENANSSIATVTGLEVGTYKFTLTVKDERNLQSQSSVTVIVREGG